MNEACDRSEDLLRRTAALAAHLPREIVRHQVPLPSIARWKIGGRADLLIEPRTATELARVLQAVRSHDVAHVVIGDASNLLFDDAGLAGAAIRIGAALATMEFGRDGEVHAGAGLWVPWFVRRLIGHGLAGATHAIGIPGRLGGLIVMNGGSQRRSIGESLVSVDAMDAQGRVQQIAASDLKLAYRSTALQDSEWTVIGARFRFAAGDPSQMRRDALQILADRRRKFPRLRANCGSVFVSDPALYERLGSPGAAIERVGLKGYRLGAAQISPEHANFIVNRGNASSADVLRLIKLARDRVAQATGIAMRAEVRHVSPEGIVRPAHLAAGMLSGAPDDLASGQR